MGMSEGHVSEPRIRRFARDSPQPQANILINRAGRACLAGFNLLTIASSESTSTVSSCTEGGGGGTIRWMSPELLGPERFGLEGSCPTRESDCYALGMVIYEVLSGQAPFPPDEDPVVVRKVLEGEHPERPQGESGKPFTDAIWGLLKLCWKPQPNDRTSVEAVLQCLERKPSPMRPASNADGDAKGGEGGPPGATAGEFTFTTSPFRLGPLLASIMSLPNHMALQQLHHLDRSPSKFHDQLGNALYGKLHQHYAPQVRRQPTSGQTSNSGSERTRASGQKEG